MSPDRTQQTEVVLVTPSLARKWLSSNAGNRRVSTHIVKSYARQMSAGEWVLTHQGIAFDQQDCLKDGQHRLHAVIEAGVEVPMSVTWGISESAFDRMDVGFKRQAGHLLGTHGTIIAGAARMLTNWPTLKHNPSASVHQIVTLVEERPSIRWWASSAQTTYQRTSISPSIHLAVLAVAATTQFAGMLPSWIEGLGTGAGLDQTDPRLHVRNRWAVRGRQINGNRNEAAYMLTRAWNSYALGEPLGALKWSDKYQPIPVVGGVA